MWGKRVCAWGLCVLLLAGLLPGSPIHAQGSVESDCPPLVHAFLAVVHTSCAALADAPRQAESLLARLALHFAPPAPIPVQIINADSGPGRGPHPILRQP